MNTTTSAFSVAVAALAAVSYARQSSGVEALKSSTTYFERSKAYGVIDQEARLRSLDIGFLAGASEVTAIFGLASLEFDDRVAAQACAYRQVNDWTLPVRAVTGLSGPTVKFMDRVSKRLAQVNAPIAEQLLSSGSLAGHTDGKDIDLAWVTAEQSEVEALLSDLPSDEKEVVVSDMNRVMAISGSVGSLENALDDQSLPALVRASGTAQAIVQATDGRSLSYLRISDRILVGKLVAQLGRRLDATRLVQGDWITVMQVNAGDKLNLQGFGTVVAGQRSLTSGPEGISYRPVIPAPTPFPFASLVGRIVPRGGGGLLSLLGGDDAFLVGQGTSITAPSSGELQLRVNNSFARGRNTGFYICTVGKQ